MPKHPRVKLDRNEYLEFDTDELPFIDDYSVRGRMVTPSMKTPVTVLCRFERISGDSHANQKLGISGAEIHIPDAYDPWMYHVKALDKKTAERIFALD